MAEGKEVWMGNCYTEAPCEAMVMCGNNHWIIKPNLPKSIQIDPRPRGQVLFMATSDRLPSHSTTKDGRATDSCFGLVGPRQCGVLRVIAG